MGRWRKTNRLTTADIEAYRNGEVSTEQLSIAYGVSNALARLWLTQRGCRLFRRPAITKSSYRPPGVPGRPPKSNPLTPADVADYEAGRARVEGLAAIYHACAYTVYHWLRQAGATIQPAGNHRRTRDIDRANQIVALCNQRIPYRTIGKQLGISGERVRQIYRRHSGDNTPRYRGARRGPRLIPSRLTPEDIQAYRDQSVSLIALGRKRHAAAATVARWLREAGVPVGRKGHTRAATTKRAAEIIARYQAGETVGSICKDFNVGRARLYHILGGRYVGGTRTPPDEDRRLVGNRQRDKRLAQVRADLKALYESNEK